ncbi:MAG: hypothetical protein KGY42_04885, partial [Desulfobacterales bacterium]|nr:hypothetical protein [Desulfobacterales bacterium]
EEQHRVIMLLEVLQMASELFDRHACGRVFVLFAEMMVNKGPNLRAVLIIPVSGIPLGTRMKQNRQTADKNDRGNNTKNPFFDHKIDPFHLPDLTGTAHCLENGAYKQCEY